jgi:hypothetical protein
MRKVGGLLLVMVVAGATLLGAASAGAAELPTYGGDLTFPAIQSPAGPEEFSWRVELHGAQELRQGSEDSADVFWASGVRAFTITTEPAHDATGANVPTTLSVTAPDVITLTVHHRDGNPAAGGAPFEYPVSAGPGWEGGFSPPTPIPFPPDEAELRAARERAQAGAAAEPPAAEPQGAPPQQVRVVRALGEDKLYYRPHFFLLSGDGTFGMNRVRWQSYGGAGAKATARAFVDDCIPYCAAGHVTHPAATLRLSKVVDCNGTPIYAHLDYAISGPLPKGFPRRGGYSMRPLGEDGKPEC